MNGACDRCKQPIKDFTPPTGEGFTVGYYHNWTEFMDPGERIVCGACIWADPRYIAVYGRVR